MCAASRDRDVATTDELIQADQAFAGNRLLSTFSAEARALVEPYGTVVELEAGDSVLQRGEQVRSSLFPIGPAMVTMMSIPVPLAPVMIVPALEIGRAHV